MIDKNVEMAMAVKAYLEHGGKPTYPLDEEGFWLVRGEDRPCGQKNYQPFLGIFEGKFINVLTYATHISDFYASEWGYGGEVEKIGTTFSVDQIVAGGHNLAGAKRIYTIKKKELEKLEVEIENLEKIVKGE